MQLLKELLIEAKKQNKRIKEVSENWLIEQGYIKTEAYGWEKPEILEKFNLNLNCKGIPHNLVDGMEYKKDGYKKRYLVLLNKNQQVDISLKLARKS